MSSDRLSLLLLNTPDNPELPEGCLGVFFVVPASIANGKGYALPLGMFPRAAAIMILEC